MTIETSTCHDVFMCLGNSLEVEGFNVNVSEGPCYWPLGKSLKISILVVLCFSV